MRNPIPQSSEKAAKQSTIKHHFSASKGGSDGKTCDKKLIAEHQEFPSKRSKTDHFQSVGSVAFDFEIDKEASGSPSYDDDDVQLSQSCTQPLFSQQGSYAEEQICSPVQMIPDSSAWLHKQNCLGGQVQTIIDY